ncbi:MFS transporter small subunit [Spirillospora sp. CA-108201]
MPQASDPAPEEGASAGPDRTVPRLVVSWSVVGIPLIYGVVETVRAILPLFGG